MTIERGKGRGIGLSEIYEELRGHKHVDCGIDSLSRMVADGEIDFDPPYQRGHVWTEDQQKNFVGFLIEGGRAPEVFVRELPVTEDTKPPFYEVVDGKQRMTAMIRWWNGEIPARLSEEWDSQEIWVSDLDLVELRCIKIGGMNTSVQFLVDVTDAQVMRFHLRLNRGGTVHTDEEIERVQRLYEEAAGLVRKL